MPRANRPIDATLDRLQHGVETRVKSAAGPGSGEVAVDGRLRQRVDEAFANPSANVPAREVFRRLRSHHARRLRARQCRRA